MKNIVIFLVVIALAVGGWYFFFEYEAEEVDVDEEEVVIEEDDVEEDVDTDDPYETAETVVPMQERNEVLHEDFSYVLGEVFEKEPKLVSSGDILVLSYVVDRVITSDDVSEIRDLLVEEGYELVGTDAREDSYDLNFSVEVLGQEYSGNFYVLIHTVEEGESAQKIEIRIL